SLIVSALLFPIGKIFAYTRWDLSMFSVWKVLLMLVTSNIFFGFFALWLSSVIDGMSNLNSLWRRYIAPIWLFGGYVYSWHTAYQMSPIFAWVSLINPMIYVMEGMRSAALGAEGYLPFWLCFSMLWFFIIVCGTQAIKKMKVKLDCI
ncbi:ABC transporter permease, partial [bacterium]|nr:ABC transporter permease [bacterium]